MLSYEERIYTDFYINIGPSEFFDLLLVNETLSKIFGRFMDDVLLSYPKRLYVTTHYYPDSDTVILMLRTGFVGSTFRVTCSGGKEIVEAINEKYAGKPCPSLLSLFPVLRFVVKELNKDERFCKVVRELTDNQKIKNWYSWNVQIHKISEGNQYTTNMICNTFLGLEQSSGTKQYLNVVTLGNDGLRKERPLTFELKKINDKCKRKKMKKVGTK